jgi:pSer/pThr/pTyr-binding forkhead associated (FHA) protein
MNCPRCGASLAAGESACPNCQQAVANAENDYLELPDGRRLVLDKESVTLGRGAGNDFVLEHSSISRRHARLQRLPHGWLLIDLNSLNGTSVNGDQLVGPCLLQDCDQILLGEQPATFHAAGPSSMSTRVRRSVRSETILGRSAFGALTTPPIDPSPNEHPTGGGTAPPASGSA